jgi:hypothetical protein
VSFGIFSGIVDAELQEGDGFQAIKSIRTAGPVPHVFISGTVTGISRLDELVFQSLLARRSLCEQLNGLPRQKTTRGNSLRGEP